MPAPSTHPHAGALSSARIDSYLLERSRLVERSDVERNFHILYQLTAGSSPDERAILDISADAQAYTYLRTNSKASGPSLAIGAHDFKRTREAMSTFAVGDAQQAAVFRALAALIHLGNVELEAVNAAGGQDGATVPPRSAEPLKRAAELMRIPAEFVADALCTRTISAGGGADLARLPQSASAARSVRDALAKAVYGAVFDGMLMRVNASLGAGAKGAADDDAALRLGILDMFGFENLPTNSFEQLLINYANETLQVLAPPSLLIRATCHSTTSQSSRAIPLRQAHFSSHLIVLEQAEYAKEGVACADIRIDDNSAVLRTLLDKPAGANYTRD